MKNEQTLKEKILTDICKLLKLNEYIILGLARS